MPAVCAERLCPEAIFVEPNFTRYRAVSRSVGEIFKRHTDLIEPLSLDEAYLDGTENKTSLPTATWVARPMLSAMRYQWCPRCFALAGNFQAGLNWKTHRAASCSFK